LGLVDAEVPGLKSDFGVSLMKDNRIAFGTGSSKGDSTLLSNKSVKEGDRITVMRKKFGGFMGIWINSDYDNHHNHGSEGTLNASSKVTVGSLNVNQNYFTGGIYQVKMYNYANESCRWN
jgi:hypothetical protein